MKEMAYKSLVRPILEYSSCVWDPDSNIQTRKLEQTQRRAARFCLNNYKRTSSVSAMLNQLAWLPLADRRKQARLTMLYKIQHEEVAIDIINYLAPKNHIAATRTENSQAFHIPRSSRDYHRTSFFPRTARDWNRLPEPIVQSSSVKQFKTAISSL